ncbi:hypothetical protein [Paenibacillus sp. HJGM_3]|uniref:hypothetical protein n=1 Tax=Paenibacillus sp. HJGM_3 TaxID=3379816 RepID=UPI00385D3992
MDVQIGLVYKINDGSNTTGIVTAIVGQNVILSHGVRTSINGFMNGDRYEIIGKINIEDIQK